VVKGRKKKKKKPKKNPPTTPPQQNNSKGCRVLTGWGGKISGGKTEEPFRKKTAKDRRSTGGNAYFCVVGTGAIGRKAERAIRETPAKEKKAKHRKGDEGV